MPDERPIKRRRTAKSCEHCRRRKVRCDQGSPCGPCTRSRASLPCSYGTERITTSLRQENFSETEPSRLPDISQNAGIASDVQPRESRHEPNSRPNARDCKLEETLRNISEKLDSIQQLVSSTSTTRRSRLLAPTSKMKLLGPTHWSHKVEGLKFTQCIDGKETEPTFQKIKAELANVVKDCRSLRHSIKEQESTRLNEPIPDLFSTLPPKYVCDELINCYLRTFELVYRVVHIPSFWKEYGKVWEQPERIAKPYLMKLVLILAIGSTFYPHEGTLVDHPYLHLAHKWIYAAQCWLTGPSEKATFSLNGLQVFCLLLISRRATGLGDSPWLSAGSLLRMATVMGLHREPANFPTLSVFQSEMRSRLWTTVLELTLQLSLDSCTPLLLPQGFAGSSPRNVDDQDISPDTVTAAIPKPSNQRTESSIQILLRESLRLRVEAVQVINSHQVQPYHKVWMLGTDLREVCRKIASFFQHHNTHQPHPTHGLRASDFHRKFLDMQIRRYLLFIHTPFMIDATRKPEFCYSRNVCLGSAMVIASYADNLNLPQRNLDDFSRLIMIGKGSFKGPLGLDIISVLGREVITQLEEDTPADPSTRWVPDQQDELERINRAPVINKMEHILGQLGHIIALGCPSFKRYAVLTAMLAQIRAMESGRYVKQTVYHTLRQGLQECCSSLETSITCGPQETIPTLVNGADSPLCQNLPDPAPSWLDAGLPDPDLDLELANLLGVPGLEDIDSFSF